MADLKLQAAGYLVESFAQRSLFESPSHVTLHRLGSGERGYLTPEEADALAEHLRQAAANARKRQ